MPIPQFFAGEVLSAMRLNQMAYVVNTSSLLLQAIGEPFEQVELNQKIGQTITWNWLFRYVPKNRYYKVRYLWFNRQPGAFINADITGAAGFTDGPGGPDGQTDRMIDLSTLGLFEGATYTLNITADRDRLVGTDYCRIIWAFTTNKDTYFPTIIG